MLAITEIFGDERVASNYMAFDGLPGAIGAVLVAKVLASSVYDSHKAAGDDKCHGDDCFRASHMVVIGIELLCSLAGVLLAMRTRVVYRALAR